MIRWLDIASPTLRKVHQAWLGFRGTRLMARVSDYNSFVVHAPPEMSMSVILPMDGSSPMIKHAGSTVRGAMPGIESGLRFDDIMLGPAERTALSVPFHRTASGRQPEARRGAWRIPGENRDFEQLLLPFDNDHLRVVVVHAVFEFRRQQRSAA
ncbi:MAG: hypothetical protein FJX54_21440 [Alphaproteobacteria bacterium]|nr:hypothetical protein [Alphaproteobacteria bacterium]